MHSHPPAPRHMLRCNKMITPQSKWFTALCVLVKPFFMSRSCFSHTSTLSPCRLLAGVYELEKTGKFAQHCVSAHSINGLFISTQFIHYIFCQMLLHFQDIIISCSSDGVSVHLYFTRQPRNEKCSLYKHEWHYCFVL